MRLLVRLLSCDDETGVDIDATPEEAAFLGRLAALVKAESTGTCMPRMTVEVWGEGAVEGPVDRHA